MAWAAAPREVALVMPRVANGREGLRPVMPDEPAWAELGRIDPAGHGHGSYDLVADRAVRLSERVIRVTADNGSMMTGPGTNTYLVGGEARSGLGGDRSRARRSTPTSRRSSPPRRGRSTASSSPTPTTTIRRRRVALKARTGATVHGLAPRHREWQDATFAADVTLHGGERIALGRGRRTCA